MDIIMLEISTDQVNSPQISTLKIWTITSEKVSKYIVQVYIGRWVVDFIHVVK